MSTIDYARMNALYPKQKAALTRAIRSGDPERVRAACERAIAEWGEVGAWPDGWHRWHVAYADAFGWAAADRFFG